MSYLDDIQDQQSGADDPSDSGLRPETTDYLNNLAGIGTQAYLAMRDPDLPEYEDWRDSNFASDDSGNYVSREGQSYTDDQLEHMHGFLSRQAGNPFVSGLFDGPDSPIADYMVWRNQNFSNDNGPWEDEDGNLYSEQALQGMFADKFAAEPEDSSGVSGQNAQASAPAAGQSPAQDAPGELTQPTGDMIAQARVPPWGAKQDLAPKPPRQLTEEEKAELERRSRKEHPGVEILTFDPVGYGRSSFGHQAISIDGHTYSFGENGWEKRYTTIEFLANNNFRNATGQVLNLTPDEATSVLEAIKKDIARTQKWTVTNNCTTKVRDMLEQGTHKPFWVGVTTRDFAPADFSHMLDFLGYVSQTKQYPKAK